MRKLPFLLLGISIAACNSKKNSSEHSIINQDKAVINSSATMNAMDDLKPLLVDAPQVFTVPAKTIKKIEAAKGLRVTVDANNLETPDGQDVTGDVLVSIKEMVKASDMIANNCPTVSDGKMLVSDGAYYIGMMSNGKRLQIKKGKSLQMEFPAYSKNDMELFYGERNSDGTMNWKPMNQKLQNPNNVLPVNNPIQAADKSNTYDPSTGNTNSWAQDMPLSQRLELYEDSVKETRRAYVVCHYKKMTQDDIRKVMEAPYKMAMKDLPKYGMRYWYNWSSLCVYSAPYGTFYIDTIKGSDSVYYYVDFINEQRKIEDNLNRIDEVTVGKTTVTKTKRGLKVTIPGKIKITTQYYDPVEITNLGWINCDHYYSAPEGITPQYTLYIKDSIPDNVGVYMIFKDINSMLLDKVSTNGKNSIIVNEALPLNSKIEFLIYTKRNNRFIQCKEMVTVTKNMILPVAFTPVPDDQVKKIFLD